jgi:hypothetical protein
VLPSSFMTHYPVCFATTLSSTQTSRPKHVEWKEVADPPSTPDSRKSLNSAEELHFFLCKTVEGFSPKR